MRLFDDQLIRTARRAGRGGDDRAASPGRPNVRPTPETLDQSTVLDLQRSAGNAAVTSLLGPTPRKAEVGAPLPHLDVSAFGLDRPYGAFGSYGAFGFPDKSPEEKEGEFDQEFDVGTFSQTNRGLRIVAEMSGVTESEEFPDGFKFTQVIETNAPLNGATSPYTDPHPNDDTKPFYWTDPENERYRTTFRDHPKRNPPTGAEAKWWRATLGLNGVNEATQTVTGFGYITYGFTMDAAGNITLIYPQSTDGERHRQTLVSEFSGWTFD